MRSSERASACPLCDSKELEPRLGGTIAECLSCGLLFRPEGTGDRKVWSAAWASPESEGAKKSIYAEGLSRLAAEVDGRALLDVGCGFGTFLAEAESAGWDASGLEAEAKFGGEAQRRGRRVTIGRLDEYAGDAAFDAVTFWDVLEALPDPVGSLEKARSLLKPGGVVLVRTRNAPAHLAAERGLGWLLRIFVKSPATFHRFGFGDRSLPEAFRRAGLEPLWLENSPMTAGDPYGTARGIGAAGVTALKAGVGTAASAAQLLSLGRVHLGTSLWAAARKPGRRPRVLHLITRLDPGGSAESTWSLVRDWDSPAAELLLAYGGGTEAPGGERLRHLRRQPSWRDLPAAWEIYRLLRRLRPDAIHTHSSKAGFLGRLAARAAGVRRAAHTPHGHVFYGYFGAWKTAFYLALERGCVSLTDAFLALTEGEKRESVGFGIGREEAWCVAPSGTPLPDPQSIPRREEARRKLGLELEAFWVGSILRLEWVKGPDVLVEAAARLRDDPRLRWAIIGDGPMRDALRSRLRYWGLEDRFVLAGQQADVWPWLAALDLYVQPSRNEAMGRTLVQAQAAGLPVVASRVCGIPDVVREGSTGLLVPSENPARLASAIASLAADAERRKAFGEAGRVWVYGFDDEGHRRFSPDAMRAGHRKLYEALFA